MQDGAFLPDTEVSLPSIFTDASVVRAQDPAHSHHINQSGQTFTAVATATWLCSDGHAMYTVATTSGSVLLMKLLPLGIQGQCWTIHLVLSWLNIQALVKSSGNINFTSICIKFLIVTYTLERLYVLLAQVNMIHSWHIIMCV